ncbi:hypothetical protein [Rossellomorea marisflavi]|uniref:hypothetical protein n=1 Tax=Rossellomorea marisflavi TaxID=189381 RepID=UPI003F9ECA8E
MGKTLNKLALLGTAFTVAVPTTIAEVSAKDYLNEGDNSLTLSIDQTEGVFNSRDKERAQWYSSKGQNKVYKTYRNYFYFYSPVRPRDVKKGVADYSGLYENWYTRFSLSESSWDTRYMLVTRDRSSSKYNQNFKTKTKNLSTVKQGIGGGFEESKNVDKYGQFAGIHGEWRYLGYSKDATTIGNPMFPEDYIGKFHPLYKTYTVRPWDTNGWAKTYVPGSSYDRAKANASSAKERQLYKQKLDAINKIRKQSPIMKTKSASWWMNRLSLTSDPINDTAVFRGAWSKDGSNRYTEWSLVNDTTPKNMMVEEMTVKRADTGAVVAKFNRSQAEVEKGVQSYFGDKKLYTGTAYNVEVKVKNLNKTKTTLSKSMVEVGFKENYNAKNTYPSDFKGGTFGNEFNKVVTGAKIPGKSSRTFTLKNVVIPDRAKDTTIRMSSMIGAQHRDAQDNLNTIDDVGILPIRVVAKPGDMKIQNIQLVNKDGKVVPNPIPGESYKVRYTYKYSGADIKNAVYKTRKDKDGNTWYDFVRYDYPSVPLSVNSTINRTLPSKTSGNKLSGDVLNQTIKKTSTVRNGQTFEFETKFNVFEVPKLSATGDFNIGSAYSEFNSNGKTDSGSKSWAEKYDYSVENLQVLPRTERATANGKIKVAVSFTAVQTLPKTAKDAGFEQDVDAQVTVNGKTITVNENLKAGKNKNIVVETEVDAKVNQPINASVFLNRSTNAWESDLLTQKNNQASTVVNQTLLDAMKSNDFNTNTGGFVTSKMLSPTDKAWKTRTSNSWTQNYEVRTVNGNKVDYTTASGSAKSFYKYRKGALESIKVPQNESYEIKEVLFKSKFTKDNGLGKNKDGWVSMMTAEKEALIKAGYGYELKVVVQYKTNAFSTQPKKASASKGKGTTVRPYNVEGNFPNNLFVKTPDKTLSVNKGLVGKVVKDTPGLKEWEFTLQPTTSLGVKENGKVYVGENVKDGKYGIQVWTPVVNGVPTKKLKSVNGLSVYSPSQLADQKKLKFEVKGSATDDLVDTIIQ